jgi:thioredoxin 1
MAKFGDIINSDIPVLIQFYDHSDKDTETVLNSIASEVEFAVKLIKIDIGKNPKMAEALRIRHLPTYMVYKNSEMKWRQSGYINPQTLIGTLKIFSGS